MGRLIQMGWKLNADKIGKSWLIIVQRISLTRYAERSAVSVLFLLLLQYWLHPVQAVVVQEVYVTMVMVMRLIQMGWKLNAGNIGKSWLIIVQRISLTRYAERSAVSVLFPLLLQYWLHPVQAVVVQEVYVTMVMVMRLIPMGWKLNADKIGKSW